MRALLDVNALIALVDEEHDHHEQILEWLQRPEHLSHGFATCAVTQLGFIRVMSSKGYFKPVEPQLLATKLTRLTRKGHRYLDIPPPIEGGVRWQETSSRQSTDSTLLATAVAHGCRLVTFDAAIKTRTVVGAKSEHLVVVTA